MQKYYKVTFLNDNYYAYGSEYVAADSKLEAENLGHKLCPMGLCGLLRVDEARPPIVLWVEELENTDKKQAKGCLYDSTKDGYCCLGIACNVFHSVTGDGKWVGEVFMDPENNELTTHLLHSAVKAWLTEGLPFAERHYMAMNDDEDKSFKEIAAAVRKNYPKLFN
jgi:hypothetical protein